MSGQVLLRLARIMVDPNVNEEERMDAANQLAGVIRVLFGASSRLMMFSEMCRQPTDIGNMQDLTGLAQSTLSIQQRAIQGVINVKATPGSGLNRRTSFSVHREDAAQILDVVRIILGLEEQE